MKCKNAFSPSQDDPGLQCSEILTEQHHKDRVDINNIIQNYTITGVLPDIQNKLQPFYGDFSNGEDFLEAQIKIKQAEESFMALPPQIRREFDNQPYKLLEFISNPQNLDRARELGLANPLKTTEPSLSTPSKQTNTQ
nr:MAG: internal scaffolding protein [Microvirus sp.]